IPFEPRRKVPNVFLRVPGHRRLEQVTLAIDQVGAGATPGPQRISDLGDIFRPSGTMWVLANFLVKLFSRLVFHQEFKSKGRERIMMRRVEALQGESFGRRGQRLAHGMTQVGDRLIRMTGSAYVGADILHGRTNIQEGIDKTPARIVTSCR